MPIFEYECRGCHNQFELLVLKDTIPACPGCQGQDLEKLLSAFAFNSDEITRARVKKARAAAVNSSNYKDQKVAEADHIREHVNEHRDEHRTK